MPISEAYQQAILNGLFSSLVSAAGDSLVMALLYNDVELVGNGYIRKTISTIPDASAIGVNDLCTVRLVPDTPLTAVGGDLVWNQIQILDSTGTNLLFPTFSSTGTILQGESKKVAAVFGLPDNDELISRVTTLESSVGTLEDDVAAVEVDVATLQADVEEINLGNLGLIGLLPDGTGQTAAEGTAELVKLNAFTRGQDWHDKRANIDMECLRVPFGGTDYWEITRISGLKIKTSGLGGGFSENQYGSAAETVYNVGGLASGAVWVDRDNLTGMMIQSEAYGIETDNFLTQGLMEPTNPSQMITDLAYRKDEGWRLLGRDVAGTLPSGKSMGNHTLAFLKTGMRTVETPFADNADQLLFGRFRGFYCDTVFKSENRQTLGCRFDYVDQLHCTTGFEFVRGGKNWIGSHCIQAGCTQGVLISGVAGEVVGYFDTDELIMDGTSGSTALALKIQPSSGYIAPTFNYANVAVDYNLFNTGSRASNPLFSMLGFYGAINITGGSGLYERMFHITGGVVDFFPTILVTGCTFKFGADMNSIRKLFTTTSSGYINVIFVDNHEVYGGVGSANNGKTYSPYRNLIEIYNNNSTVDVR
jgi:hypothetical protein